MPIPKAIQKEHKENYWGIEVIGVQINNIELPKELVRAMAKEAEAEREKKAILIRASGEHEASENYFKASKMYEKSEHAIKLRELKTWEEIGKEQNSVMIVIPSTMTAQDPKFLIPLAERELREKKKKQGKESK